MTRNARVSLGGAAILVVALIALGLGTWHAARAESALSSPKHEASALHSDAYYDCLSAQAHALIPVHDVVYLPDPTLTEWVTLVKVIGGWAHESLKLRASNMAVTLQGSSQSGSCDGQTLVTITRNAAGHLIMARGHT
jgi:hypothetical protein